MPAQLARLVPCLLLALASCASPRAETRWPAVRHWGELRAVLREGRTEGRVRLADVLGPHTLAVGALEGLEGEITARAGVAHVARVDPSSPSGASTRLATEADRAALLVAADVERWSEHDLWPVSGRAELERAIASIAAEHGLVRGPFPFRVEGVASALELHVLDRSCPLANPDGPSPWRYTSSSEPAALIGFYAEGQAGILTHHGQSTHAHAILVPSGISGHVDAVAFEAGARLFLPAP